MAEQMTAAELAELRTMASEGDATLAFKLGKYFRMFHEHGEPGEYAHWFATAAQRGHGDACWELAEMALFGHGIPRNVEHAFAFLNLGATLAQPLCLYNLGVMYLSGEGCEASPTNAFSLFLRAAKCGEVNAQYNVGMCYAKGIGTEVDLPSAQHWLRAADAAGDPRAAPILRQIAAALGEAIPAAPTVTVNLDPRQAGELTRQIIAAQAQSHFEERKATAAVAAAAPPSKPAEPTMEQRAEAGDVAAMVALADQAKDRRDDAGVETWLGRAAAAGLAMAHHRLGQFYGCGGEFAERAATQRPRWYKAREHLAAAAAQGMTPAQNALTQIDRIIADGLARAGSILQRATAGDVAALYDYAAFLRQGEITPADDTKAVVYFELAARQGLAKAQYALYHLFITTHPPELSREAAIGWLVKAAMQQHPEAVFWFAEHYSQGKIRAADHPLAADVFADCRKHYPECCDPGAQKPSVEQLQTGANQQRLESIYLLALRIADGDGVHPPLANAIALLQLAIARGYAPAQYALARIYAMGRGVERNMDQALALALAAARQGHVPAFLELRMFGASPEQIGEIERLRER